MQFVLDLIFLESTQPLWLTSTEEEYAILKISILTICYTICINEALSFALAPANTTHWRHSWWSWRLHSASCGTRDYIILSSFCRHRIWSLLKQNKYTAVYWICSETQNVPVKWLFFLIRYKTRKKSLNLKVEAPQLRTKCQYCMFHWRQQGGRNRNRRKYFYWKNSSIIQS